MTVWSADDAVQAVFPVLRKASALARLAEPWGLGLLTVSDHVARNDERMGHRRKRREQETALAAPTT